MNEATPRRYSGSLLERADALFAFAPSAYPVPAAKAGAAHEDSEAVANPVVIEKGKAALPPLDPVVEAETLDPIAGQEPMPVVLRAKPGPTGTVSIDRDRLEERGLIVPGAAITALAEEFRLIKRQLLLTANAVARDDAVRAKRILVCSAQPDDGKTFCALNLALSLASERDTEVLLIDADFAKPDVLETLDVDEVPGLLDALADPDLDPETLVIRTDIPKLTLLSAGTRTTNDTELVASDRARDVLDRLAENTRRIVVLDSSPTLAASPASVLALNVGQIMMVVRADRTSESDLREAVAMLDGCEHIQLVLNGVSFQPSGNRFGSYYGQETSR